MEQIKFPNVIAKDRLKIEAFDQKYSLIFIEPKVFVCYQEDSKLIIINKDELSTIEPEMIEIEVISKVGGKTISEVKMISIAKYWLSSKDKRLYMNGFCFSEIEKKGAFNLWKGFRFKKTEDCKDTKKIEPIYNLILNNLSSGNKAQAEYILNWLAHMIQKPFEKPEIALVFKGEQGIGKTTLFDAVALLFHPENCYKDGNIESIFGKYNDHLKDKIFVSCEEALFGRTNILGDIKNRITSRTISIEAKFKGRYEIENFTRFVFTSNNESPAPVEKGNRRFFVAETTAFYKKGSQFFKDLYQWLKDTNNLQALFNYLASRDISSFDYREFPNTCLELGIMENSYSNLQKWLLDYGREITNSTVKRPGQELFISYQNYCNDTKQKYPQSNMKFFSFLKDEVGLIKIKASSTLYSINREALISYWERITGNKRDNIIKAYFEELEPPKQETTPFD